MQPTVFCIFGPTVSGSFLLSSHFSRIMTCPTRDTSVELPISIFAFVEQNHRVDPGSSHPLAPRAAEDSASNIDRTKRSPDAKARRRKREPVDDEKSRNGDSSAVNIAVPKAEWVPLDEKISSGGEFPGRQAVATVAAVRGTNSEQESVSAEAVHDRNHGVQTPVRPLVPRRFFSFFFPIQAGEREGQGAGDCSLVACIVFCVSERRRLKQQKRRSTSPEDCL